MQALRKDWEDEDETRSLLSTIFMCEKDIYTERFLRLPASAVDNELVDRFSKLRRYEFAARYGDYMKIVGDQVETGARDFAVPYYEELTGWERYWTDINQNILGERPLWRKWLVRAPNVEESDVPVTSAIFETCNHMRLNFDRAVQAIEMYADRNSLVHASVMKLVTGGRWHLLKEVLANDLRDLPVVIPHDLCDNIIVLQEIIEEIVDQYYTRNPKEPHNFNYWNPRESSYELFARLKDDAADRAEERRKTEANAAKRLRKVINAHSELLSLY